MSAEFLVRNKGVITGLTRKYARHFYPMEWADYHQEFLVYLLERLAKYNPKYAESTFIYGVHRGFYTVTKRKVVQQKELMEELQKQVEMHMEEIKGEQND